MSEYLHKMFKLLPVGTLQRKRWLYLFTVGQSLSLLLVLHILCNIVQTLFTIHPISSHHYLENLPVGHGKYNSGIFTVLPLIFAQSGSNNARSVVYTTQMITIYVINVTVCFNFTTARIRVVGIQNCSNGFKWHSVRLVSSRPL